MFTPTNYIADVNKFKLAKPPTFRLRELAEFDPSLVIIPSREHSYHILALRDRVLVREKKINELDPRIVSADEAMLREYGLVNPLKLVSTTGGWNWSSTDLRPHLWARSVTRMGGSTKVIKMIEDQEELDRQKRLKHRHEDILTPRIRAGARALQMRQGSRMLNAGPATQAGIDRLARSAQRASSAPSGSTQPLVTLT